MNGQRPLLVVGAGWLGRSIAAADPRCTHRAQRSFDAAQVPHGAAVVVASGWSSLAADDPEDKVRSELDDVARLLDVARTREARIVVVGSSDVCGLAEVVSGSTAPSPVSRYGELKTRREALVVEAARDGVDAVAVRLAPTHGPGKAQTARMVALATKPIAPLPRGGRYSVGFITLADAVEAFVSLTTERSAEVVSVGAGSTELASMLRAIASSAGRTGRIVPLPVPVPLARRLAASKHARFAWAGRFASPRCVEMEASVSPMSTAAAGRYILESTGRAT